MAAEDVVACTDSLDLEFNGVKVPAGQSSEKSGDRG